MSENSSSVIDVSVLTSRIDPRASDSCDSLPACVVHFANKMIDVDGMEYYSNTSYDSWEILLHSGWSSGLSKRTETWVPSEAMHHVRCGSGDNGEIF